MLVIQLNKQILKIKTFAGFCYRTFIIKFKINLLCEKKYENLIYLLHAYFFFFNFEKWTKSKKNINFLKLMKQINRKKCFIDIGAHAGFFSIVASKKNKKCSIHSFEPSRNFFFF